MTNQTKNFIELSDLIGIQLECKKETCGVSLLVSGAAILSLSDPNNMTLAKCPSCGAAWTVSDGYPTVVGFDTEVKKFLRMIDKLRGFEENIGCRIRFEIKKDVVGQ